MSHVQWAKDKKEFIVQSIKYCPYCLLTHCTYALRRFIQGRHSVLKAGTFCEICPKWPDIAVQAEVVLFRGPPPDLPGLRTPWLSMEEGHSCLPSLLPWHSLPCLAATPPLDTGDPRNSCVGGSCWSHSQSQSHDSDTHVGIITGSQERSVLGVHQFILSI